MVGVVGIRAVVGTGAGGINHAGVTNAVAIPVRSPDPRLGHRVGLDAGVLAEVGVVADDGDVALAHRVARAAVGLAGDGISVALVEAQVVVTVDEEHPLAAVVGVELDVVREGGAALVDDRPEPVGHRRILPVGQAGVPVAPVAVAVKVHVRLTGVLLGGAVVLVVRHPVAVRVEVCGRAASDGGERVAPVAYAVPVEV